LTNKRKVLIVINPVAGHRSPKKKLRITIGALKESDIDFDLFYTEPDGKDQLIDVINDHPEITDIFVIGGDGTLNYVVNELSGRKIHISILSSGTGNDSVKSLHGTTKFKEQLQIALHGAVKIFDLGKCNNRFFINGVGIGFDGEVVNQMVKKGDKSGNSLDYFVTVMKIISSYKEKTISFQIDGEPHIKKIFLMTVSNGSTFGGNFLINPFAKTDDGLLDICIFKEISVKQRFRHLPKMKKGKHVKLDVTEFYTCKKVTIAPHKEIVAHLDGELIGHPPFDISLAEEKLYLRVPDTD
jgi:diacylglycerol kinase (ATP)